RAPSSRRPVRWGDRTRRVVPSPAGYRSALQTFLPFPDFAECARVLDPRRLGKQRVEALQIVRAITVPGHGWRNHPAVLMWREHLEALGCYGLAMVDAWLDLGYADTCAGKIRTDLLAAGITGPRTQLQLATTG